MKQVRHTGIVVRDLNRALRFYRDLLGLKVVKSKDESGRYISAVTGIKGTKIRTVKMAADDGNLVELVYFYNKKFAKTGPSWRPGMSHISFTVDDIDAEYKRLRKEGAAFISAPKPSPGGYARMAFCKDFEGNLIELVEVLDG